MSYRLEFVVTASVVKRGLYRFVTGVSRRRLLVVAACLLVFSVLTFSPQVRPLLKGAMLAMTGLSAFVFVARIAGTMRRSRKSLQKLGGEVRASLTIDESGLHLENPLGVSDLPWSFIHSIWAFDDVWLIFISEADFMTVPSESLGDLGKKELIRLARENRKNLHMHSSSQQGVRN
jgi:hypothetical protein